MYACLCTADVHSVRHINATIRKKTAKQQCCYSRALAQLQLNISFRVILSKEFVSVVISINAYTNIKKNIIAKPNLYNCIDLQQWKIDIFADEFQLLPIASRHPFQPMMTFIDHHYH